MTEVKCIECPHCRFLRALSDEEWEKLEHGQVVFCPACMGGMRVDKNGTEAGREEGE